MRSLLALLLVTLPLAAEEAPGFEKDIAPIFQSNCAGCHAGAAKMGGLSLDTYASLMKGGQKGVVILPGKSAESRLYLMVAHKAAPAMPLAGQPLGENQIEVIRQWIDAGAKPPEHDVAMVHAPAIPIVQPQRPVHAEIGSLAYSPDGKLIALGTFKEVRLVDTATGKTIATLPGEAEVVRAVAFSPDGKLLAAAGGLPAQWGQIKIWDVEARAELRTIKGHADCIYSVAFSPDGKTLASASYDKLIYFWDAATGNKIRTLKDHVDAVYALVFTPDGKRLVSAAADRSVKVWDAESGQRLYTMSDPLDGLNALTIDPTGRYVAAGGLDKTIRIWELGAKEGKLLQSLIAHEDSILQLKFSPDGKTLLSTAADRSLKAFRVSDLTNIKDYPAQPDWVLSLAFAPDGKHFACGRYDGSLAILDSPVLPHQVASR